MRSSRLRFDGWRAAARRGERLGTPAPSECGGDGTEVHALIQGKVARTSQPSKVHRVPGHTAIALTGGDGAVFEATNSRRDLRSRDRRSMIAEQRGLKNEPQTRFPV